MVAMVLEGEGGGKRLVKTSPRLPHLAVGSPSAALALLREAEGPRLMDALLPTSGLGLSLPNPILVTHCDCRWAVPCPWPLLIIYTHDKHLSLLLPSMGISPHYGGTLR